MTRTLDTALPFDPGLCQGLLPFDFAQGAGSQSAAQGRRWLAPGRSDQPVMHSGQALDAEYQCHAASLRAAASLLRTPMNWSFSIGGKDGQEPLCTRCSSLSFPSLST